jgi:hypothetical protein
LSEKADFQKLTWFCRVLPPGNRGELETVTSLVKSASRYLTPEQPHFRAKHCQENHNKTAISSCQHSQIGLALDGYLIRSNWKECPMKRPARLAISDFRFVALALLVAWVGTRARSAEPEIE